MRLLLDTCVWGRACEELRAIGHDVIWAGDWPTDPGDEEILARAHREARTLVTLDKDFGELAIVHDTPHSGILRLVGVAARNQAPVTQRVLAWHGPELMLGAIVTADSKRLRIRPGQSNRQ